MPEKRIFLSPPHLSGQEEHYVSDALRSNWVAPVGPHIEQFEQRIASIVGVDQSAAVASGTAALHLILRHLQLQPGDEVFCSTLTFCASANPIRYEGAQPVFIDSDDLSWNMDPNLLDDEIRASARRGRLPRAVIVADIFGQSADMDAIIDITSRYNIPVIEDAAEALGTMYRGTHVGSRAWASFFSFNGNKILTTSAGGAICSNDRDLVTNARFLATQAREPAAHYEHIQIGYNYRMSNILAAIGLAQLKVLDDRVKARRSNFELYQQQLGSIPGISFMPEADYGVSNRWLTVAQIDANRFGISREKLHVELECRNIESRPVWKPLHQQPAFAGCRCRGGQVSEQLFRNGLCLPSGSALTIGEHNAVVEAILKSREARTGQIAA